MTDAKIPAAIAELSDWKVSWGEFFDMFTNGNRGRATTS
jgi:hypothetical protein